MFYCPDIADGHATLDAEESRHLVRVLRHSAGDEVEVTDGQGALYRCRIVDADASACTVAAVERLPQVPRPFRLHLAVAPTKNPSRMEWLVEKAVEVGLDELTLLDCDHSERSFLKTDRLQRLAVSAMKQSLHTTLPVINPAVRLADWLQAADLGDAQRFIAHCDDSHRTDLAAVLRPGRDTVVLIGPEGDFSKAEIALALQCGFQPVSLGPARLRTETAALYAVVAANFTNTPRP